MFLASAAISICTHKTSVLDLCMSDQDTHSDDDSLFGSPPSSPNLVPTTGRFSSLALPGGADAPNLALPKNVGAIALPGSHDSSEHVVNLPASPPRRAAPAIVPQKQHERTNANEGSTPIHAVKPKPRKTNKKRAKTTSATPEPANRPSLTIPDADQPLPPNFLRNQQALLGLAGVVGGINPAQLSVRGSRGTTAQNPIVVDEEETPSISTSAWKSRQLQLPNDMPIPSSQAISDTLITQGNIIPVLRSLLPYFGAVPNSNFQSSNSQLPQKRFSISPELAPPPLKRRKLNSVPAGAADWDVPYPFPENEGPQHYLQEWEKERGKKLVAELVSLVRDAVKKAAAKTYVKNQSKSAKNALSDSDAHTRNCRPPMANQGFQDACSPDVPLSDQTLGQVEETFSLPSRDSTPLQQTPSDVCTSPYISSDIAFPLDTGLESLFGTVNDSLGDPLAQFLSDEASKISTNSNSASPTLTSSTRLSTPSDFTLPSAFLGSKETPDQITQFPSFDLNDLSSDHSLFSWPFLPVNGHNEPSSSLDILSGLNAPGMSMPMDINPTDEGWYKLIFGQNHPISSSIADPAVSSTNVFSCTSSGVVPDIPLPSSSTGAPLMPNTFHNPVSQPRKSTYDVRFMPPITVNETHAVNHQNGGPSKPAPGKSSDKMMDRGEVLHKAKLRRKQLTDEIARAKIELWETTIEQGILTHLSKDKELWRKDC